MGHPISDICYYMLVINWASHTCDFNVAFSLLLYTYIYIYIYILSHVLSRITINISIFHLGSYIRGACTPGSALWPAYDIVDGSTVGKCALPVVIYCIRNFRGVGGQANIARHQTMITRNRHNRSDCVLSAAVYMYINR